MISFKWQHFQKDHNTHGSTLVSGLFLSNSRRSVSPVLARVSKKLFRRFVGIDWTKRSNEGLSGGGDAVLPPDRECEFISRDALKQGSKARCVFQRELLYFH